MARPCKERKIDESLEFNCFKPVGKTKSEIEIVELDACELQAIKHSCHDGLSQSEAAKKMEISSSTFNRILKSAQKKISDALINGKGIKINS